MKTKNGLNAPIARFTTALVTMSVLVIAGCALGGPAKVALTDSEITSEVKAGIAADSRLDAYTIGVTTTDANVSLSGAVATGTERDAVERIASASRGVDQVDNNIRFGKAALSESAATP